MSSQLNRSKCRPPPTPRLPFWSELPLEQLPPGRYVLQLTATEAKTNRTAVERVGFHVE